MKKQANKEELGVIGWLVVLAILILATVGAFSVVRYMYTAREPLIQQPKEREVLKVYAKDYTHIQFFDGSLRYSTSRSAIDFLKIKKVAEAVKANGEVIDKYEYEGIEVEGAQTLPIKGTTWLTKAEFERVYLPLGRGTEDVTMLCRSSDNVTSGKILMTIETREQKDVFIIEDNNGNAHFIDHYEDCEKITNYKKL